MKYNILEELKKELLTEEKYVSEEGTLLKSKIFSDVMQMKPEILNLILSNDKIKEMFFVELDGKLIFDKQQFLWLIDSKEFLEDSYTSYTNKIGLYTNDGFISKNENTILSFPYKDCILYGGQDKENQDRDEIFFNTVIANEDIRNMLSPKVFTNFKKYSNKGIEYDFEFNSTDNFIIKGNNLIALHSLKEIYANKIKMIYIDPPYNTGNDGFNYNDSFNHSSWLVFMKNRLEVARELLMDNGSIFVQCDDNEQAYLKVLMDEIFGRENFISTVVYRRRKSQANLSKNISPIHDFILIYGKTSNVSLNNIIVDIDDSDYKNPDNDPRGPYVTMPSTNRGGSKYKIKTPTGEYIEDEWRFKKETFNKLLADNRIVFPRGGKGKPRYKMFLKDKIKAGVVANTWWDDLSTNQDANKELLKIFESNVFSFPKAEGLIKRIIELGSDENDIILDFFMGSGTTPAVAHKMNRRYIGIEQMDYIESVSVPRLQKIIEGEDGGISSQVNWKGGGAFVYCELKENNKNFIQKINLASSSSILDIKKEIINENNLIPYISSTQLFELETEFIKLTLPEQKKVLIDLLDANKLYVNLSDVDDLDYDISESDKNRNKSFYNDNFHV